MAKIHDLSVTLRPDHLENSELELNRVSHEEAARIFAKHHRLKVSDLPHGSFFSSERIELRSHLGTHLDAPYHFYPTSEGSPASISPSMTSARRWKKSTTARSQAISSCSGRVEQTATTTIHASPRLRRV